MVGEPALRRRAAELGVGIDAATREHAVLETLAILSDLDSEWILRGGTALAYGYFNVHRLSEDIDLTKPGEAGDLDRLMGRVADRLSQRIESDVEVADPVTPLPAPDLRRVELVWQPSHRLQIDFSWHDPTTLSPQPTTLVNPHRGGPTPTLQAWALEEIMATKWNILDDRAEPRDLYDVWFGLVGEHIAWSTLVECHTLKYRFRPLASNLDRRGLAERWADRLAHQVRDLPDFADVRRELRWLIKFEEDD